MYSDECLNRNFFENTVYIKEVVEQHRIFYNTHRPHSSLGGKTPYEVFKQDA
ncbi:integrase core domain-containing protein [Thermodesulfovibrio thiophilus]|uniref:integrase core domain-containing protein n=1 Tax=Thermodesulfovibrio thiophilus TaxID=340095 RepID=UPI003B845197